MKRTVIMVGRRLPGRRLLVRSGLGRWIGRLVMDDRSSLREFWTQPSLERNDPAGYVLPIGRSRILEELLAAAQVPKEARILEVGCNVGRNLAYLHDQGRTHLAGIEVNPHAVEMLRRTYPQLVDVPIYVGAAEDILPTIEDDSFDVVYTMAVLEHIHPDSKVVFDRIAQIGSAVLAIEPKGSLSHRTFPHDVPALFVARGMRLVREKALGEHPDADGAFEDTYAWLFER